MYLDLITLGISHTLAVNGIREKAKTIVLKRELRNGDVILDIGSNIGYYPLIEARIVSPNGRVYAVEPDPRNYYLLRINVHLNNLSNIIETYRLAISEKSGQVKFYLSELSNLSSLIKPPKGKGHFALVKAMTIDDFIKDKKMPNLIRMDIEGYECKVIDGISRIAKKTGDDLKLLMEVHSKYYKRPDMSIEPRLEKLFNQNFKPKTIISSRINIFRRLGYKPFFVVYSDGFYRYFYENIREEDLMKLIYYARYVLLERTSKKY
jgi:FkbM family methyltransferase